jgi:hypothetical protein
MKTHLRYSDQTRAETDPSVIETLVRKGWEVYEPEPVVEVPPTYTAEAWLEHEGYGAMRLLGLLDLEVQFMQAGAIPPKMQAVRAWINTIRAGYSTERSDWPEAPHTFEQTMQEATTWLTN